MAIIYLIDDDPEILETLTLTLMSEGHQIMARENLKGLRELLAMGIPDLLLLDVNLPDGDGIDEVRRLREETRTKFMPIIMLSALVVKKKVVEGLKAGANDYIPKPVEPPKLLARINSALKIETLEKARVKAQELEALHETAATVANEIHDPLHFITTNLRLLHDEKCRQNVHGTLEHITKAEQSEREVKHLLEHFQLATELET